MENTHLRLVAPIIFQWKFKTVSETNERKGFMVIDERMKKKESLWKRIMSHMEPRLDRGGVELINISGSFDNLIYFFLILFTNICSSHFRNCSIL